MKKENKGVSAIKVLKILIPMIIVACPGSTIILNLTSIFHGAFWGVETLATQKFFDSVSNWINGSIVTKDVIYMAMILGIVMIVTQILNGVCNFLWGVVSNKAQGKIEQKINLKASRIDPLAYEDTDLLDDINKAKQGLNNGIYMTIIFLTLFTFYLPYFLFMAVYLFKLKPMLSISLVIIFIPVMLTQLIRVKIFTKLEDESAPIRREYEYYEKCICDREYFKETRMLGIFPYFRRLYRESIDLLGSKVWKAQKKAGLLELSMKFITLIGYMGVFYLLIDALIKGEITIGAFGAVFTSIDMMVGIMEEIICRHIGSITQQIGTVKNFISFLELEERGGKDVTINGDMGISLENVTFSYPAAKESSLKNISLEVKPNETIAIVGENGAGKTTIVKLMTGLFLPTEGSVKIGGYDTKEVSMKSIYSGISGVFQKYQRYKMSLKENVGISNTALDLDRNKSLIETSVKNADLEMNDRIFPEGYETMLSREFDGVDLSGGQWQRVAIARGFYRAHNMIVLDEPTASIDPIEETKIYNKFAEIAKGKTAIIVTHRLGSAKIADRIVVMDKGEILEIGTHDELMTKEGKYAEMYNAQAKWYEQEEKVVG